jgi:tRNA 2-thiouridine synthesizing protein D
LKEATMADKKTLTFAIMDAPYEDARSTTALRLMDICARRGYDINVFAYEGAVYVPFARQEAHPNAVHGHDAGEEDHPLPKEWVAAIIDEAAKNGGKVDWVNCGLCVDERGAGEWIEGVRRGTPGDFWQMAESSDNTLVIPTR